MSDKGKSINEHLGDYVELYYPEIKKSIGFCNYLISQRMKELAKTINKAMDAVAERINKMRGGRMKIQSEDFLNANWEKKEKIINMIVEFETHNSFSKDCLVAVVKYQQEKIETLDNYISDEFNREK